MAEQQTDIQKLAEAFTAAIKAARPKEAMPYEEYIALPGKREPELKRPVFQNGYRIQIKGCSDATVRNLDNLKSGDYLDGLIKVRVTGREPNERADITYPCSTVDERMAIYSRVSSFSDMIKKIALEQEAAAKSK